MSGTQNLPYLLKFTLIFSLQPIFSQPRRPGLAEQASAGHRVCLGCPLLCLCIFRAHHRHWVTEVSEIPPWSLQQVLIPIPLLGDGLESTAELGLKCLSHHSGGGRVTGSGWESQAGDRGQPSHCCHAWMSPRGVRVWWCRPGDPSGGSTGGLWGYVVSGGIWWDNRHPGAKGAEGAGMLKMRLGQTGEGWGQGHPYSACSVEW